MENKGKKVIHHPAADALDWDEAMSLIVRLRRDGRLRDAMMIAVGCFLGLRVSDFRTLRWEDILGKDRMEVTELKTGKKRYMGINSTLQELTRFCYEQTGADSPQDYIFNSSQYQGTQPICRYHIHCLLKAIQAQYGIRSARVFSAHSLRKTFGRRIWLNECARGRGDQALELLKEVFGHTSTAITKRYLGIRQEEILSLYDTLN